MDQNAIDAELSDPAVVDLLASAAMCQLAYIGVDGTPRVIPVGFCWTGHQTAEYVASAGKTMDAERAEQFVEASRNTFDEMARIVVTPRWVRYYDFGAGRLPNFLQDLADRDGS